MNKIEDMEIFDLGNSKGEHEIHIVSSLSGCTERRNEILDNKKISERLDKRIKFAHKLRKMEHDPSRFAWQEWFIQQLETIKSGEFESMIDDFLKED